MSSDIFNLKKFDICQKNSALKVGTDAILLGAWLSKYFSDRKNILDIGTGSAIILLMLMQSNINANGLGIDIDKGSIIDANLNINKSPYTSRCRAIDVDFRKFEDINNFDLIVSNPPYFIDGIVSKSIEEAKAKHESNDSGLSLSFLFEKTSKLLNNNSFLGIVTPLDRLDDLRRYACLNLMKLDRLCVVSSLPNKAIRALSLWSKIDFHSSYKSTIYESLTIKTNENTYTKEYLSLVSPFVNIYKIIQ